MIGRDIETGSVDTLESDVEHYCGMIAYFVHFYMILVQNEVIAVSPCLVAPIFNVEMFDFNFQRIMHCIGQSMWKSIDVHVSLLNALVGDLCFFFSPLYILFCFLFYLSLSLAFNFYRSLFG